MLKLLEINARADRMAVQAPGRYRHDPEIGAEILRPIEGGTTVSAHGQSAQAKVSTKQIDDGLAASFRDVSEDKDRMGHLTSGAGRRKWDRLTTIDRPIGGMSALGLTIFCSTRQSGPWVRLSASQRRW
ncbi:MAG: hypothetical protein ACREVH_06965 [Gammaproteobacteria bacterium]